MKTIAFAVSTIAASLSLAACVGEIDDDDTTAITTATTTFTRTIVRTAADGTQTVTTEQITASEQAAEMARAQQELAGHVGGGGGHVILDVTTADCGNWYATKLFDQPDYKGNELCLIDEGYATLSSYTRMWLYNPFSHRVFPVSWASAPRSVWTGQDELYLWGPDSSYCQDWWPAYEAAASDDACMDRAATIHIGPVIF